MPTPDRPPLTRAVVLRGFGFAAAIALGAVAVWLTVTSDSQKSLRIGMLVGLWGLLLGAYSMFGARRGMGVEPADDPGREISLRESRTLERTDDADARRDWESRLERLISREISTAVGRETAALRNEIAHLRQELVDKVGGQLRLERIETTRVIGSDLSALQDEVRQLKDASGSQSVRELLVGSSDPRVSVRPVVEPARVRPVSRSTAEVEADVRPAVRPLGPVAAPAAQRPPVHDQPSERRPEAPQPAAPATSAASATPAASAPAASAPATPAPAAVSPDPAQRPDRQPLRPAQPPAARTADEPQQRAPISQAAALAAQSRIAGAAASQLGGPRRTDNPVAAPAAAPNRPAAPVTPAAASEKPAQPAVGQTDRPTDAASRVHRAPPQPPARQAPQQPPTPPPAAEDPFASLPRLSRFTDFELEPIGNANGNGNGNGNGHHGENGHQRPDAAVREAPEPSYTGRRRSSSDAEDASAAEPAGKHANGAAPAAKTGGRRRRDEDGDDGSELLARLLARETSGR